MYDPTVGRWTTEDPIGFEAGDANLYRYVHNDPANLTDPSGLQEWAPTEGFRMQKGDAVTLKNNTFKDGDGIGEVKVWINASILKKGKEAPDPDRIVMQFRTTDTKIRGREYHWIQFIYRYAIDADTNKEVSGEVYEVGHHGQRMYEKIGKDFIHNDAGGASPYYDSTAGLRRRIPGEISIADSPVPYLNDKYKETGAVAETYLVDDTGVKYVVRWKRISKKVDGEWKTTYEAEGDTATKLPDFVKNYTEGRSLFQGWSGKECRKDQEIRSMLPAPLRPK